MRFFKLAVLRTVTFLTLCLLQVCPAQEAASDYKQLKTPDFYREMCNVLKVNPEQVVHVGDNWQFDFLAPQEVGIKAFYLDRKDQDRKPDTLSNLAELKAYLM